MESKNNNRSTTFTNWNRKISCYIFSFLELLAVKTDFFNKLLMRWRKPVFLNEIELANLSSKDKVLHIGCGIFPSGSIIIAEQTNAKITSIDNNVNAVNIARSYVHKNGLSKSIKVEYGDGVDYPVKDFDVIFIAINVWPIDSVLKHLSKNAKTNTKIICKSVNNDIVNFLENENLYDTLSVDSILENQHSQSFLLIKK